MPAAVGIVLPHPPLLVPELAGRAAAELDPLRAACADALAEALAPGGTTVLLGDGPVWGVAVAGAAGTFAPYGVDVRVRLAAAPLPDLAAAGGQELPEPALLGELPLSLTVAAWLVGRSGGAQAARVGAVTVPPVLPPAAAAAIGRAIGALRPEPVRVVALADLSARRTDRAPGAFHQAAAAFDAGVAAALRDGRPELLLGIDPATAAELLVSGRVPLQVLAGALAGTGRTDAAGSAALDGRVLYDDAPYGVGYLVAVLTARPAQAPAARAGGAAAAGAAAGAGAGAAAGAGAGAAAGAAAGGRRAQGPTAPAGTLGDPAARADPGAAAPR
jgi:hypothetical protein